MVFIQQGGRNEHQHICESLSLFANEVMPEFKARDAERQSAKSKRLSTAIRAAESRIAKPAPMEKIPEVESYPVLMERLGKADESRNGDGASILSLLGSEPNEG